MVLNNAIFSEDSDEMVRIQSKIGSMRHLCAACADSFLLRDVAKGMDVRSSGARAMSIGGQRLRGWGVSVPRG